MISHAPSYSIHPSIHPTIYPTIYPAIYLWIFPFFAFPLVPILKFSVAVYLLALLYVSNPS